MQKAPVTNDDSTGSAVTNDDSSGSALPPSGSRRSARLVGVKRQYIVQDLFPMLSDIEDEDDGIAFCWRDED
jgi:outer membrane scaffolding protein for murein synthesis (MipA/OmpV family)